jgi:hypothetical protein
VVDINNSINKQNMKGRLHKVYEKEFGDMAVVYYRVISEYLPRICSITNGGTSACYEFHNLRTEQILRYCQNNKDKVQHTAKSCMGDVNPASTLTPNSPYTENQGYASHDYINHFIWDGGNRHISSKVTLI